MSQSRNDEGIPPTASPGIPNLEPGYTETGSQSPLKWYGGKNALASEIVKRIPPHDLYGEPFAGALHVLFAKPPSPFEVVNDKNAHLMNLWLMIRDSWAAFSAAVNRLPLSESLFRRFATRFGYTRPADGGAGIPSPAVAGIPGGAQDEDDDPWAGVGVPPDLHRAAAFYYLIRCAFNGAARPGIAYAHGKRLRIRRKDWDTIAARLRSVHMVDGDFDRVLTLYDRPRAFFYLDPPYLCTTEGGRDYYEYGMSMADHERLAERLREVEGSWLLSLDETPKARELYEGWRMELVPSRYTDRGELLISNYEPPDPPFYVSRYREGIPCQTSAEFTVPNCPAPGCGSRRVQDYFLRHTLQGRTPKGKRRRTFKAAGFVCMKCGQTFQGGKHLTNKRKKPTREVIKSAKM